MFKKTRGYKKPNYYDKKYSNPYFRKKRKKKKVKVAKLPWRAKLILFEIFIVFIALVWFFCFSGVFNLDYIDINGLEKISAKEIKNIVREQTECKRFLFGSQKNLILFNTIKLSRQLNENYAFEWVLFEKKLPNQLIINLAEKKYVAIWHELGKYYYIDNEGNIIEEIDPLEIKQKNYPLIDNQRSSSVQGRKIIDHVDDIQYIIKLFSEFKNNAYPFPVNKDESSDFPIERFILDNEVNTVKMALTNGPIIYFNTDKEIGEQIVKLTILIREKLKDDFKSKSYIDLRYGDRIYYR